MSEAPRPAPTLRLTLAPDDEPPPNIPLPAPDNDLEDRQILRDIAAGNRSRFDLFVNRYKTRLFRFLFLRLGDLHTAEDLTQDVFLKVIRTSGQPFRDGHGRISTWLFTVAQNCLTDHLRSRRRRADMHRSLIRLAPRDSSIDPVTAAAFQEERTRVAAWLDRLPDEQREALALRLHGDLTVPEIAEVTGVPLATAKSRLRYGLSKIADLLGKETNP
jgi:RNA polymerase sigma factor (sigma-70 family)